MKSPIRHGVVYVSTLDAVDTTQPNPKRFDGCYKAADEWGRRHPNPLNPFKKQRKVR